MANHIRSCVVLSLSACLGVGIASVSGCSSTMIAVKDKLGYARRDQLSDKVQITRDSQEEAKKQFESALAEFIAVTGATDKDLEAKYNALKKEYDRAESRASTVRSRITETDRVASSLFAEWQTELGQYSDANLRASSESQMNDTKARYAQLIGAMRAASSKMDPVLGKFKDQVLFLKHNLNARAIASLQGNVASIQSDVSGLIKDMEASIAEANRFIEQMKQN